MGATAAGAILDGVPEGLPDGLDDRYHMLVYNGTFYPLADNLSLLRNLSGLYPEEQLYNVPVHIVLLLTLFYVSISVAAIVGNGLVLWVVATSRRMQSVTNTFIANLALADVIIGLFAIPFQFQAALLQRWNLPEFMCPFCPFVQVVSVNVSVFTLTAIAVDRHRAVLSPLSAPPTKLRAKVVIGIIWLASLALAAPMAVALRVIHIPDESAPPPTTKPFCTIVHLSQLDMLVYRMVLCVLQYLTPLIIISWVYSRMAHRLWGSRAPGNAEDSRDATLLKNKKKVIKMLVIVVSLFALCWLPLQTYNFLHNVYPDINRYRYINIIFFCCDWLAMSNSCYNPFIYGIYNEKFQREFRLRLDVCLRRSPPRGSISRELSNLDSGRWDHRAGGASLAAHRNGDKALVATVHGRGTAAGGLGGPGGIADSTSGISVLTGRTSLTP